LKLNRKDWDFTGVTEEYLGPAIVYEHSREVNAVLLPMRRWLNAPAREILAEARSRFETDKSLASQKLPQIADALKMLTLLSSSTYLESARFGRDILDVFKHKLSEEPWPPLTEVVVELNRLTPVEMPDIMIHFLMVSPGLQKNKAWAFLAKSEKDDLRDAYDKHFGKTPVNLYVEDLPFKNALHVLIDWNFSDTQITASFKRQLKRFEPKDRRAAKLPGRAAALPYDALRQLSALRLGRESSFENCIKSQCPRRSATAKESI